MFEPYLARWRLTPDGAPIITHSSRLLPVRWNGQPAMLKIACEDEERQGHVLMRWWDGEGAARVFAWKDDALLMERATGARSLDAMARGEGDDEATRILCATAAKLHGARGAPPDGLIPLAEWFAPLAPEAARRGGLLARAAEAAETLLASQRDVVPLHGDLHHGNVLDFGARGWLAIDPKRLIGERGFDFANILRNPEDDLLRAESNVALTTGRYARQARIVAAMIGIPLDRLLQWSLAFAGLSAAWIYADGDTPALDLAIADLAMTELARY